MGAAKKMISKAKTSGGVPAKVTAKQRIARKKNIVIARKSKKKAMSTTQRKFIQSQSQKTLVSWIGAAKKKGDTQSVQMFSQFLKKKGGNTSFKKRGNFLAARVK